MRIFGEGLGRGGAGGRNVALASGAVGEITQSAHAADADDVVRGFRDRREDAVNAAGFATNGAVGEGEVALLGVSISLQKQQQIVGPGGFAAGHDVLEHGADDVPDLRPAFTAGTAERGWMLGADDVAVGVVVEHHQVRPPPNKDGEAGVQADADGRAEALRPIPNRAQQATDPIVRAHQGAHFAAAGQTFIAAAIGE